MEGTRDEAIKLFNAYRVWWLQTSNIQKRREERPINLHKQTEERVQLFQKLITWCGERELDPRLYLYSLFRGRRWLFAPQLREGHLMSENMISRYKKMVEKECLGGYRQFLDVAEEFDPNRDMTPSVEALKSRYLKYGQADRCMLETPATTFGYHPKSPLCQTCPLRIECENRLQSLVGFDIQALRRGEITADQARAQLDL